MSKRGRAVISEEQKTALKNAFKQGMTRVGSPMIAAAAEATGLAPVVLDNWIGNYRRSLKPSSLPTSSLPKPQRRKLYTRDLSAYNLYCRDLLRNKGNLKDIQQKWSSLGEDRKKKYRDQAAALKDEHGTKHLSHEMRELKVKRLVKRFKSQVSSLEMVGVETAVMLFDSQTTDFTVVHISSKGAAAFLDSTDTLDSFVVHFKGSSSSVSAAKEPVDALAQKVQEMFNQKYNDAGGRGRLPYQSLQKQSFIINASGLPAGLTLKKPSRYGRKQLENILKAADQISFEIDAQNVEEAARTSSAVVVTLANDTQSENRTQTVEDVLEAMCGNDVQSAEEPVEVSGVEVVLTDAANISCICDCHFNDEKKKWREWRQCSACHLWSHLACGFRKNLCSHCQHHNP